MKRIFFKFLISVTILSVVILAFVVFLISMIISKNTIESEQDSLNYAAWFSATKKVNNEMNFISKGRNLKALRSVTLSKAEINSLLYMSITANEAYGDHSNESYNVKSVVFNGKEFIINIAITLKYNTPFGRIVNLYFKIIPGIYDNNLEFEIKYLKLGDLSMPSSIINYLISGSRSQINKNEEIVKIVTYG